MVNALATTLQNHPHREFIHFLINGFTHGFCPGIEVIPDIPSHICHNLQSALFEPNTVYTLLAKEAKEGSMITIHFSQSSASAQLTLPLGNTPSPDFSMQYATVNHAITLIHLVGHGAWLS